MSEILNKRESNSKNDRGIVHVETTGFNQHKEDVISFQRKILIKKRPNEK